ncbi:hypothetical protein ACFQY4_31175 [Catellatospora bangladeshensis]|uniref:hypothetical protein n=1 Tax=Catellatospora bangladeshensis TaxID=310355 RepID=UPI00360ADBD2
MRGEGLPDSLVGVAGEPFRDAAVQVGVGGRGGAGRRVVEQPHEQVRWGHATRRREGDAPAVRVFVYEQPQVGGVGSVGSAVPQHDEVAVFGVVGEQWQGLGGELRHGDEPGADGRVRVGGEHEVCLLRQAVAHVRPFHRETADAGLGILEEPHDVGVGHVRHLDHGTAHAYVSMAGHGRDDDVGEVDAGGQCTGHDGRVGVLDQAEHQVGGQ